MFPIFFAVAALADLLFTPRTYKMDNPPAATVVADFDGDRAPDIAVAAGGGTTVTLLWNDGHGRFDVRRRNEVQVMRHPHLLAAGDLNGDGRSDIAVTAHDSNDVMILWNGTPGFGRTSSLPLFDLPRPHNHGLAIGDVTGDGHADITAGHQDANAIAVLAGDGRGNFRRRPALGVGRSPYPHIITDLNGDRRADIAVPAVVGNAVQVLFGDGSGRFRTETVGVTARPYFVAAGRINRDRHPDLVAAHDDTSVVTVLLGDGRGRFRVETFDSGRRGWKLAVADLDRDGRAEIVTADDRDVRIFSYDTGGGFRLLKTLPNANAAWEVVAADVNRDGAPDLVVPNGPHHGITVWSSR